jgi:hypothetical protein
VVPHLFLTVATIKKNESHKIGISVHINDNHYLQAGVEPTPEMYILNIPHIVGSI